MFESQTEKEIQEWEMKTILKNLYKAAALILVIFLIAWGVGLYIFVQTMREVRVDMNDSNCTYWCKR